jgi:hypothetical protein
MRLVRVQVPEFRALKDVDITFEPDFYPQVFPVGSLNGGGKSTLLQLIFVLLHCSADEKRKSFIANMLDRATIPENQTSNVLAKLELLESSEKIELEFILCNDGYLRELDIDPIFNKETVSFDLFTKKENLLTELSSKKQEIINPGSFSDVVQNGEIQVTAQEQYESVQNDIKREIATLEEKINNINPLTNNILKNLILKNQYYIVTYSADRHKMGLLCHSANGNKTAQEIKVFLTAIAIKVFLSAPSTQIYLFLSKNEKQQLFKRKADPRGSYRHQYYEQAIEKSKSSLRNFLTYDVFAIDTLVSLIETARNQDFKTLVDTGTNGLTYQKTIEELNALTRDKTVLPLLDDKAAIIGVVFKTPEGTDIYPEDLSHGELKRLSLYVWLKLIIPQNENIVLMDEIENAFHPDWQRHIVDDLLEWGLSNQYILATHSYELCRGVTPAHISQLQPRLLD